MKKTTPLVSVIVVNYNGSQFLKDCFGALLKLNYPRDKIELFMVDNGSDDDSVKLVKKNFPKVKIFKNDLNNYARGNNLGIKKSRGEFIALVNNDVQVSRNWLKELVLAMLKEKRTGIAGGKILLEDGRLQSAGHEEYPDFYWGDRGFRYEDKGQYERPEAVQSLCGAAVLLRRSCLEEIGLYDEDFIMYLEDVDICLRAAKKKWKVSYVPKSTAKHHFRGTSNNESVRYFSERNRLLLIAKHFPLQLGKALYGKGYFTGGENSIYDIFPLIFKKLLEAKNNSTVNSLLPGIFKNLKKITVLESSILMDRIGGLNNTLAQKEAMLADLGQVAAELKDQLQKSQKESESQNQLLAQKEAALNQLQTANNQLDQQLKDAFGQLSSKDLLLSEKQALVDQKDQLLAQKEAMLADLGQVAAELKDQLQKSQKESESKNQLLAQKEAALNQLQTANNQLDQQLKDAFGQLSSKDLLLSEKQALVDQKDQLLAQKEAMLADLGQVAAELKDQLQKSQKESESQNQLLAQKEAALNQLQTANNQLDQQLKDAFGQLSSKDLLLSEKQALVDQKDQLLAQKEAMLADLGQVAAELKDQLQKSQKESESQNQLLAQKEAALNQLQTANNQLDQQLKDAFGQLSSKDLLLSEKQALVDQKDQLLAQKEAMLADLGQVAAELKDQLQKSQKESESQNQLLAQKEAALNQLQTANNQLDQKLQEAQNKIASQTALLFDKQALEEQLHIHLHHLQEELTISRADLEKTVRFDQKLKILIVKPRQVSIEDTVEAIRLIKNKFPHSSIYLHGNLLKQDFDKLIKYQVEKRLINYQDERKTAAKRIELFSRLLFVRFDLAVTLVTRKQGLKSSDHRKARLITLLSNSRQELIFYVD